MESKIYSFRDDYSDGAHPDILAALTAPTAQSQTPYGEDSHTIAAEQLILSKMNCPNSKVYLVAGGTLANLVMIASCLRPHEAIIAASSGHITVHETGAIEATGHKIISVPPVAGKLRPESIIKALAENSLGPHMAKPRLVYVTNATEVGTLYRKDELSAIADVCKSHGLLLMLDGARLGVALAARKNDLTLEDIGQLTDMFWIGGTKVGALFGEAIVINNPALQGDFRYHIKQRGGLLAKGQALGSQFQALFQESLFFDLGKDANQTAVMLSMGIRAAGYILADETETNQVFPIFSDALIAKLQARFLFHVWETRDGGESVIRLVTSWATTIEQIVAFLETLKTFAANEERMEI